MTPVWEDSRGVLAEVIGFLPNFDRQRGGELCVGEARLEMGRGMKV